MADERTMSVVTMLNTAQRNRQKVDSVMAMVQIRGYYQKERKRKVPTIQLINISFWYLKSSFGKILALIQHRMASTVN